jgi:hypothetical protein
MLVVRRSSQIIARGTAALPIIFSSSKLDGERARGDWGGLIINGRSTINSCAGGTGVCEAFGEGGTGFYGGDDEADNSGVLEYVRVEFAGTLISPDNELNGIAFQGVGSGTTVDHIQVHMNADDGVEFFGGTVNVKHVLVTGVGDDSMDWTDGWRGRAQHIVLQQYDDGGDQGIDVGMAADGEHDVAGQVGVGRIRGRRPGRTRAGVGERPIEGLGEHWGECRGEHDDLGEAKRPDVVHLVHGAHCDRGDTVIVSAA